MLAVIDWANPVKSTGMVRGKPRTDNRYLASCPDCGNSRLLRADDAKKAERINRLCSRCHAREAGKRGYQATVAKKGKDFAIDCVQQYRLANPSSLEKRVMDNLSGAGITYEREVLLQHDNRHYLVDFIVGDIAIEVQGEWVHQFHKTRDANKAFAIIRTGYTYLGLLEDQIDKVISIIRHLQGARSYA
jgi:very-short-patch-repair endonuclease